MKNQYIGDVGDYGKYGLLRFLAQKGVKIGVNWYLTKCDPSVNHGNDNKYLENSDNAVYDGELFEAMKSLAHKERKSVADIEALGLIPGAVYFREKLSTDELPAKERPTARESWHSKALAALIDAELVFADPDVGTFPKSMSVSRKGAEHYADLHELADHYFHGQDVVYYCHKAFRTDEAWRRKKREFLTFDQKLKLDAHLFVLTYSRGMQRSYIFAVHPGRAEKYRAYIDEFLAGPWGRGDNAPFWEDADL